jgi:Uma2 family endonuclease
VKTVVLGPLPAELEQLIERRHQFGLDTFDEVWDGTYHLAPAPRFGHAYLDGEVARVLRPYAEAAGLVETGPFNLGEPDNYRVPDHGYRRGHPNPEVVYVDTAAVVVEIVSPDDETYEKLPFYAAHRVDEVLVIESLGEQIRVLALVADHYEDSSTSAVLAVSASDLKSAIRWPQ